MFLLLFRSFGDPLRVQSLRLPGQKLALVLLLEFSEQRLRDPSSAIVGAEFMVIDDHDAAIWHLDKDLARGHQDSEVGDGGLRREAKSLRKLLFEGTLDRIELTVLCAAASSHQAVANAINLDSGERLFDHGLLAGIQRFRRHVNRGDVNSRIEPLQEAVGKLRFPIQFHGLLRYVSVTVKFERQHRVDAAVRSIWHCESPLSCRARTARGDGSCQSLRCPRRKPNQKISARQLTPANTSCSCYALLVLTASGFQ